MQTPKLTYFVCGTPRSGSSLLCEALTNTGLAGRPDEFFGRANTWAKENRVPVLRDRKYLETAIAAGSTPNGVFGAKIFWTTIDDLVTRVWRSNRRLPESRALATPRNELLASWDAYTVTAYWTAARLAPNNSMLQYGLKPLRAKKYSPIGAIHDIVKANRYDNVSAHRALSAAFPDLHYVFIERRDKVRQAISMYRAVQTGIFQSTNLLESERKQVEFNFDEIDSIYRDILSHEASWAQYFADNAIRPYHVIYEDFWPHYGETALNVLRFLGISVPADLSVEPAKWKKQAGATSDAWVEQFNTLKNAQAEPEPVHV